MMDVEVAARVIPRVIPKTEKVMGSLREGGLSLCEAIKGRSYLSSRIEVPSTFLNAMNISLTIRELLVSLTI